MDSPENAAMEYLDMGFSIIPIVKGTKMPPKDFKWEPYQQRQPTVDEVEAWFKQWPDSQIALVTGMVSGVGVIDADGPIGVQWMKKTLPTTPVYQKTAKGWHAFYKLTETIGNKVKFLPELDVRGQGGYVLIAPSLHPSGSEYKISFPIGGQGWDDLPEFPYDLIQPKTKDPITLQPVDEGERNDTMARIIGSYIDRNLSFEEISNLCAGWNLSCSNPLSQKELTATVTSIFKTHYRNHPFDYFEPEDEKLPDVDRCRTEPDCPVEIYKLTSPSGKAYIGQTKQGTEYRVKAYAYKNCPLIEKALKKYGVESFKVDVLYTIAANEAGTYEKRAIKEHNTLTPNGYNLEGGSDNYVYRSSGSSGSSGSSVSSESSPDKRSQAEKQKETVANQAKKYTQTLIQEIREWILEQTGIINVINIDREFCLQSRKEKNSRSSLLNHLKKQGKILPERGKSGCWRVLQNDLIRQNPLSIKAKPYKIPMPLGTYKLVDIYPKNIIIVAGAPNSGKTSFALNLAFFCALLDSQAAKTIHKYVLSNNKEGQAENVLDMSEFFKPSGSIKYFNSEMDETELSKRISVFPETDTWTKNVEFYERSRDFQDVIDPNGINIIDYLSILDNFWEVGKPIQEIHETLKKGIAIICLQKKPGAEYAKGGSVTLEVPRLVINMDNNSPFGGIAKIAKAKAWATKSNPNGLERDYKIVDSWQIVPVSDWRYMTEKERLKINVNYGAEKADKKEYAYELRLEDGSLAGLNYKDRQGWINSFPAVDIDYELTNLKKKLEFRSWLKKGSWFFQVSGHLRQLDQRASQQGIGESG